MRTRLAIAISSFASIFLLGANETGETMEATPVEMAASCDSGVVEACVRLGQKYYDGSGVTRNRTLASKLFSRACDKQHTSACAVLANSYLNGDGVRQNYNIAYIAADRACALDDKQRSIASACAVKARIFSQGLGRAPDYGQAFAYLNRSCEMGQQDTCVTLSKSLRLGRLADSNSTFSVTRDLVKARNLANAACNQNNASGCYELAQFSNRKSSDYARHIARSCDLGSGNSCFELAKALDDGSAQSNLSAGVRSLEHYRSEACRLNTRRACSWKSRATLAREERERREREALILRQNPTLGVMAQIAKEGGRACLYSNNFSDKLFGFADICDPLLVLEATPKQIRFQFKDRIATLKLDPNSNASRNLIYRGSLVVIPNSSTDRAHRTVKRQLAPTIGGRFNLYPNPKVSRYRDGKDRFATRYVFGVLTTGETRWLIAASPTKRGRAFEMLRDLID